MSTAFSRSVRSLEADGFRRSIFGFLLVFVLLGAWTAWFFFSRVARYEVTDQARLEVDTAAHPMQATVSGRVIASRLALGTEVHTGDILVELDSTPQRLELMELRARLAAIPPQIESLRDEVAAEQQARGAEQHASITARDQVQAQIRESEATAKFAEDDSKSLRDPLGRSLPGARQAMTTENPVYTIWLTLPHHLLPMPAPELADRAVFFHPRRLRKQPVAGRHLRGWPLGIR